MMKAKWRRVLVMILCLSMVFSTFNDLITFATVSSEEESAGEVENGTVILEYRYFPEGFSSLIAFDANAVPFVTVSNNALELKYNENITSIKISYLVGNNWVEITENNGNDLPADTNVQYRFDFTYNISVSDLKDCAGQMVYKDLPDWFRPVGTGALMDGEDVAALIEVADGKIVITFDPDWLSKHKDDTELNGTFSVMGRIDWHALPEDGKVDTLPGLSGELNFENDVAQKYGNVKIDKSEPELVEGEDGAYYLKYTLTVTNADSVAIPDVTVRDVFTNANYIKEYIGVAEAPELLPGDEAGDRAPWEDSSVQPFAPGKLSAADGSGMLWEIGELQEGEVRTLTYYAQIADSYVSDIISNPINNRADVYSGDNLKDTDAASFAPKNSVKLEKNHQEINIGSDGNGTISYKITITADEGNTFPMEGLTLQDAFLAQLKNYVSGDEETPDQITVTVNGQSETVSYHDASFMVDGLDLAPGDVIEVEYTVHVKNIFFAGNDQIELTNTATVSKDDRPLSNAQDTVTLEKQTWIRKIVGEPIDEDMTIPMTLSDNTYEYNNSQINPGNNPGQFNVPKGSVQYQVVLNENGQWDLSSTQMTDQFGSDHLKYVGYVQIQLYKRAEDAAKDLSDQALIAELGDLAPEMTVWLKVDGRGSFTFRPEELGLPEGEYTYLLTYYAKFDDFDKVGAVEVTNSFKLEGEVGVGNGDFVSLPGIEMSVGKVIQGGSKYEAEKKSWYYAPSPVYQTGAVGDRYTQAEFSSDYANGAIYWIIRLEGDIGAGSISGYNNNNTTASGFYVKDSPVDGQIIRRDAVVGVYVGSKEFDFTVYDSFPSFIEAQETAGLTQLEGNPKNDRWFHTDSNGNFYEPNAEYEWHASNDSFDGIFLTEKFFINHKELFNDPEKLFDDKGKLLDPAKLLDDQAIFIVLRTAVTSLPSGTAVSKTYSNTLSVASGGKPVEINTASYTLTTRTSLYKESKGAYIYDKATDTFENCSNRNNSGYIDWTPKQYVQSDMLTSSGIYAAWLLNVNWNGSMDGTYDIVDYLPKGMELVYVDVNNFGMSIKRLDPENWPETEYILELRNDPAWKEMEQEGKDDLGRIINTITYYNSETGEVRWRIKNLTKSTDGSIQREINFRIICRVNDPELFLNQAKTYENTAIVLDPETKDPENPLEIEKADVTIKMPLDKSLDRDVLEKFGAVDSNGNVSLYVNRLPFKIEINPRGLEMNRGNTLPALIDVLSPSIALIESSLEITTLDAQGEPIAYTNYTYDVSTAENGQQTLIIYGLPDNTPLTIRYEARLTVSPKEIASVSNTAYWAGYEEPDSPQVEIPEASYDCSGDVFENSKISIDIIKVDEDSHSKKLYGAEFNLYEVGTDGKLKEPAIRTGTTDSMGRVTFDNQDSQLSMLEFGTVYCLEETKAPLGYAPKESGNYYFVIVKLNATTDEEIRAEIEEIEKEYAVYGLDDLHIWYDGTTYGYEIVMENNKGVISVNKVFINENGEVYYPTSGSYRFGLYDGDILLETLTIVYSQDEDAKYYLNGVLKENPYFTQYDPDRVLQVYELDANGEPIKDGGEVTLNDNEYCVTYSTDKVTSRGDVTVTNAALDQNTGGLEITKTVVNDDTNKDFTFTVTLTDSNQNPIDGTFHYTYGDDASYGNVTFVDGKADFKLKHGQTVTITGLPVGTTYKVEESDNDGYTVSVTINGSDVEADNVSGDITKGDTDKVAFVNKRTLRLPATGGQGTGLFQIAGILLLLFAVVIAVSVLINRDNNDYEKK